MRPIAALFCLALWVALPVQAADDLDALATADKAADAKAQAPTPWRIFVEAAGGQSALRGSGTTVDNQRAALDLRFDQSVTTGLRAVVSNRLDLSRSSGTPSSDDKNTLREAYLSWARTDHQTLDFGRVNVRHGAAMGYNPTDWFKAGALRAVVSPDPAVLRENRQGTFVLQGQQLWGTGALTAALSPKLASTPDDETFALNAGATNPRSRWLVAGTYKLTDKFSPELLLHGGVDTPTQLGLNLSGLVGDAAVAFGELSIGKGRSLAAQALGLAETERQRRRAAIGLTYTTGFNLSVTAEAEHNSAAPDRDQWQALLGAERLHLLGLADMLQDLPARNAWFLHATWKDALVRQLDLSAFVRRESETRSRAQWFEARYHWGRADLSLQWQLFSGDPGTIYGIVPSRRAVELALRVYL
jgi:hypothetical protein